MKVGTLKLLLDIMSHLATNMPHIAPFEGSKGHGAPSDEAASDLATMVPPSLLSSPGVVDGCAVGE